MEKAPLIGISRLRMGTDGHGVTTLVAFHGCPLRCQFCLNRQCWNPDGIRLRLSPEELFDRVRKDELYFLATLGGVTFGGGEPLLYGEYIKEVLELGAKSWHTTLETSLNVPLENLKVVSPCIDSFIIDIKDMNGAIYENYTGGDNRNVTGNLAWLAQQGRCDDVTIRVPIIPDYNTAEDVQRSVRQLEEMGFSHFDVFTYHRFKKNAIANWVEEKKSEFRRNTLTTTGIFED